MTGATSFTRNAGQAGVVSLVAVAAIALAYLLGAGPNPLALLAFLVVIAGTLFFLAGLYVRHRAYAWARWALALFLLSVGAWIAEPQSGAVDVLATAATLVLFGGAFAVALLPRAATGLVVGSTLVDLVLPGEDPVTMLVGAVGWGATAWAMWREPLAETPGERVWEGNVVAAS